MEQDGVPNGICYIREVSAAHEDERSDSEDSEDQEHVPRFTQMHSHDAGMDNLPVVASIDTDTTASLRSK